MSTLFDALPQLPEQVLVQGFLDATADLSQHEVEERVPGVTQSDVSRWKRGDWVRLTAAKKRAIKEFLDRGTAGGQVSPAGTGDHPEEEAGGQSPAEQLLEFLSQRLGHRRVAGELTDKDLIAAAYTLARKHGFTPDDYRILDRWRDQIIQAEKG